MKLHILNFFLLSVGNGRKKSFFAGTLQGLWAGHRFTDSATQAELGVS